VKALRAGRGQIKESYVTIRDGEAFLFGAHITPLPTASTHIHPDPTRTRKLLLHKEELNRLIGLVERRGYTLVPTAMYWKRGRAKLEIGLARGKKLHDKRADQKDRDWQREKERLFKTR
jgi:SsrA-binding protein